MTVERDDDDFEAPPVSTDAETDTSAQPTPPESAPESDEGKSDRDGLAEAIRSVIQKQQPDAGDDSDTEDASDDAPEKDKPAQEGQDADPDADELTAEDKALKANAQKRISKLLHQRKEFREKAEAAAREKAELEPLAHDMRTIRTFMDQGNITSQNASEGFAVMAMLGRGDYAGFLKAVTPYVERARIATGQAVADDLKEMVEDGRMSEDAAKRISAERVAGEIARAQAEADAAKQRARADETAKARDADASAQISQSVNAWVAERQAADPDFGRKQAAIMDAAKLHVLTKGKPKTTAEAVQVMQSIYQTVTERMAPPTTTRKATRPTPDGLSAGSAPSVQKPPASLEEAMRLGLKAVRG